MKTIIATIAVIFTMMGSAWAGINDQCPQFTPAGAPLYQPQAGDQEICKQNYAVIHRCSTKTPVAVFEHVTPQAISGPAKRQNDFRADPAVAPQCQAQLADYAGNPYDRGHMAAAANNTQNPQIMSESFFLSNMVPQVPNNNRGIWRILELQVRDSVRGTGQDLYVISGAIFDQGYTKIGNGVGVPTRLFKIIINKATGNVTAFLMPNSAIPPADLPKYRTTLQAVEQASGMRFPIK